MKKQMPHILLVDDDASIRETMHLLFNCENFKVSEANDGEEALTFLKTETPDIILSDIGMPNKDGFELLEALSKNAIYSSIPFVFLTADDDPKDISKAMELGANDYICKPLKFDELLKSVEVNLKRRN